MCVCVTWRRGWFHGRGVVASDQGSWGYDRWTQVAVLIRVGVREGDKVRVRVRVKVGLRVEWGSYVN